MPACPGTAGIDTVYIYIYTRNCCRSPVTKMGWGGVGDGMVTFLAHTHIFESIAQKAWDNVSAQCFAFVQK